MFQTRLCELLAIEYPIIQGALGGHTRPISDSTLISAVSMAGGLGVLATWNLSDREILKEIDRVRQQTDKPFGVNVAARSSSFSFEKKAKLLAKAGVSIVTTGRGDPKIPAIAILKEHGIKVLPVVANVKQAVSLEAKGADAIIASGLEAGGHVGNVTTFTLIPQVVDSVKIPVIAAGGIGDGRGFIAALALGASGVQIGTRFIVTHESVAPLALKKRILQASAEDTVITTMRTGWPTRILRTAFTEKWEELEKGGVSPEQLRKFRVEIMERTKKNIEEDSVGAGQVCGLLHKLKSAKEVIEGIIEDSSMICSHLQKIELGRGSPPSTNLIQ
jgi:enoyl-[acyl-carrier protein] reductase II